MKSNQIISAILIAFALHTGAATFPISNLKGTESLKVLEIKDPKIKALMTTNPCAKAALVSVATIIENSLATVYRGEVKSVRVFKTLGTATVVFSRTPDMTWMVNIQEVSSSECLASLANEINNKDMGGVGGISVHN